MEEVDVMREGEGEGTLGEAVEMVLGVPVGAVVDPTMLETTSRMNAVSARLVMVK